MQPTGFAYMAQNTASESTTLSFIVELLVTRCKFLETSCYNTVINSAFIFMQQIFLVVSVTLWPSTNSENTRVRVRFQCAFIRVFFKSHKERSNVQRSSPPTTMTLLTAEVTTTAVTDLVTWYTHHKLARTKILQFFLLTSGLKSYLF